VSPFACATATKKNGMGQRHRREGQALDHDLQKGRAGDLIVRSGGPLSDHRVSHEKRARAEMEKRHAAERAELAQKHDRELSAENRKYSD
jgi:hypothetical protein